ncbi:hypothetical protein [Yoonia sp.]|uniref:hypothetical protein n=1 Tax=Yoonia sp. TaxID=2212373 RepID=UPI00238E4531|nr:hypothetical protein [Yoonia sp.]MDE0851573.1 hypothetical protein [Yoonia sp.]
MAFAADWMEWVDFEAPHRVRDLISQRHLISQHQGIYVFSLDKGPLRKGRVLYVGETRRKDGFRGRFGDYLKPDPTKPGTTHLGALFLQDHRLTNPDDFVYVRWAPLVTDYKTLRQLEAAIMQYYQAWFNTRDMGADTPFDHII